MTPYATARLSYFLLLSTSVIKLGGYDSPTPTYTQIKRHRNRANALKQNERCTLLRRRRDL